MGILSKLFGGKKDVAEPAAPVVDTAQTTAETVSSAAPEMEAALHEAPEATAPAAEESTQVGYGDNEGEKPTM